MSRFLLLATHDQVVSFCFIRIYINFLQILCHFVTFYYKCAFLHNNVTYIYPLCYYARRVVEIAAKTINHLFEFMEKTMSKAISKARPVVEAIVVSVALVVVAIAVPAAIVYAAV